MQKTYLDCLAELGVGGAHPGGLKLTKKMLKPEVINESTKVLDAGCGTGQTAANIVQLYGCTVTALDYNKMMVKKARSRFDALGLQTDVIHGNTENLPFNNKVYDIILSESVIAFSDVTKTIHEFSRVLKETGVLLAIEMVLEKDIPEEELSMLSEFYSISRFRTTGEWMREFKDAGFNRIEVEKYEPKFDAHDVENAPDFSLSEEMDDQLFDILEQHEQYMKKYKDTLDFRIFRCSF
ncbi:class I SAM-dependent methyltransferase [Oceanobacillus salinisoli]|uniref:class I SAM-dependent methyltransferase n=1 Tax=Oceanobacillus salinisoli TaxID=2678611 RepID=UPI001E4880C4|nr:class I SAM-dependent methyltransferase [Oceanobacillus salinisoli]